MKKRISAALLVLLLVFTSFPVSNAENTTPSFRVAASLSLESEVHIYFDVATNGMIAGDEVGMLFWSSLEDFALYRNFQKTTGTNMNDGEMGNFVRYKKSFSAKEMTTVVYAQAYLKRGDFMYYSEMIPYSVHTYAARKLGYYGEEYQTTDPSLSELLVGLLNYGALSQEYFSNTAPKADEFTKASHFHSISHWVEVSSETEMGVCSKCGLVQTRDVTPPSVVQTAELEYAEVDGSYWVMGVSGNYSGDIKIEIPNTYNGKAVVNIDYGAFSEMTNIVSVSLPSGLKVIDSKAFYGCTGITSIVIPSSVEEIGANAFYGTALSSVVFGNTDGWQIYDITNLKYVDIDLSEIDPATALSDIYAAVSWRIK